MAKAVEPVLTGVDVSKAELVIARSDSSGVETISNAVGPTRRWLKSLPPGSKIALDRYLSPPACQVGARSRL